MSKLVLVSIRDETCVNLNVLTEWLTNTSLCVRLQVRALESRRHHQHLLLLSIVLLVIWLLLLVHLPSSK
jgi:ABC-type phosphate transport system permease subunit